MASPSTAARVPPRRHRVAAASATRFDRRLAKLLAHATDVFCEKGYQGASMRDLSRASGMSLAGLYYYFESKERLLFLIQKHTFSTILHRLKARLEGQMQPVPPSSTILARAAWSLTLARYPASRLS